jgi:hypothetical protein
VLQECYKSVTKGVEFQEGHKGVTRWLQEFNKSIARVYKSVAKVLQECYKHVTPCSAWVGMRPL